MKKRNVMTMALSLAMVGVIAVGGTLAYLTATDGSVTNTFAFVTGEGDKPMIKVTLTEEEPEETGDETITANGKGWKYDGVIPGQTLNKAPAISAETFVSSYVFVRVTESENVSIVDLNVGDGEGQWKTLTGVKNVYYKEVEVDEVDKKFEGSLGNVFTKVKVADIAEGAMASTQLQDITIEVAAIQTANFADAKAAYDAGVTEAGSADNFFKGVKAPVAG